MKAADAGEFAGRLRRFRQAAALTQEELAERAGVTAKAVGALERGERRRPYPHTVRALADALGLDEEDRRSLAAAAQGGSTVPPAGADPSPVPVAPTPLVGRERELAEVTALLRSGGVRLLTVTGPGGVGKTRLAWEVASALDHGAGQVAVAELAAVPTVDLVLPTIARAVGLRAATRNDLTDAIAAHLGDRQLVLVLDNLEHVVGAAPDVAELLSRCPGLIVLATSRARLRIRAEQEYPLAPLALPEYAGAEIVAASAAVRLFADRARAAAPAFVVDRHNASAVAAVCRQLDGLPLALELVASHVRYLSPGQLLARLDETLDTAGMRDLPTRQRTMRATLDWSYRLLTEAERSTLRALATFRGGFDLDDVEALVADEAVNVLAAVEGLVEQSLLARVDPVGRESSARYRLLEPVRLHLAALLEPEESAGLAERHARHYCALGREARAGLHGRELGAWLDRLAGKHANLRAALRALIESGDLAAAAHLGGDTWLYWVLRGHAGEGLRWWQQVLDLAGEDGLDRHSRAAARTAVAGLRLATGDIEAVRAMAEAAVVDAHATADRGLLADALNLWCLGSVFAGDLEAAGDRVGELLEQADALGDPWAEANARTVESQLLLLRGEFEASSSALEAAEETARSAGLPFTLATILNMRATLAEQEGDDVAALRHLTESVQLAADVGTTWTLVYSLPALAGVAARRGLPALAVTLFAAASTTAEASLLTVSFGPAMDSADEHLTDVRRQLPEDEFRRAWSHGRECRIEQVLRLIPQISDDSGPG